MIAWNICGRRGASTLLWNLFAPDVPEKTVFLDEKFDSWATLDDGWTIWNQTLGSFQNWFDVSDGSFIASNNGVLIYDHYLSYANWTGPVNYDECLSISFKLYLPLDYNEKVGWSGQVFWLMLEDTAGERVLMSRWVMDLQPDTAANGWVYWPGGDAPPVTICTFSSGWHSVGVILNRTSNSWTGVFDGVVYPGLTFLASTTNAFDVGKVQLINALREEVQIVKVDDLRIEKGAILPPPPPPPPSFGWMAKTVPSGHYVNLLGIDTPYGQGIHVDSAGSGDISYELMAVNDTTWQVGSAGTVTVNGYFSQYDTLYSYEQPGRRFVRVYVLDESCTSILASADALTYLDQVNAWYYREVVIAGLTPGSMVKVAIGRTDNWAIDWGITAEWAQVSIVAQDIPFHLLIAEAGPTQYLWGQNEVYFDGSASVSDLAIVSYEWTWVAGNGTPKALTGVTPSCPAEWFFSYGNYTVTLTVTDLLGQTDTDTVSISWGFRLFSQTPNGAEWWDAPSDGYYKLRIENHNVTSIDWTIIDCNLTSPPYDVFHYTITFNSSDELLISVPFWMTGGRAYQSEYVIHGAAGSYVTIWSFFVPTG